MVELGRHPGLRSRCSKGRTGSNPVRSTMESKLVRDQPRLESGGHRKVWSSTLLLSAGLEDELIVGSDLLRKQDAPKGVEFDPSVLR